MHLIKNVSNFIFSRRLYISTFFSASSRKFWFSILKGKHPVLVLTDSKSSSCNVLHPTNLITCIKIRVVTYHQISHFTSFPGSSRIPALSPYTGYTQKNGAVSKVNKKLNPQLNTGTAYTVSSNNCQSFSCATCGSHLMLTAGPRGQFPRWRRSRKRLSVCSVLRCPVL